MNFLQVCDKTFLVTGVANKKSVAYFSAKTLLDSGAQVVFTVLNEQIKTTVEKLFPEAPIYLLDVESVESLETFSSDMKRAKYQFSGVVHSIAFFDFREPKAFHHTAWKNFSQAMNISCFSLISLVQSVEEQLLDDASIVTISISDTKATNYGPLGPIKACLETTVQYLAKSLSKKGIRANSVCAGPLKTSASAGIPGYLENYLFSEKLTMRKLGVKTKEVADTVAFLLSPRSSGINATGIVVDAGMQCNHFDEEVVEIVSKNT